MTTLRGRHYYYHFTNEKLRHREATEPRTRGHKASTWLSLSPHSYPKRESPLFLDSISVTTHVLPNLPLHCVSCPFLPNSLSPRRLGSLGLHLSRPGCRYSSFKSFLTLLNCLSYHWQTLYWNTNMILLLLQKRRNWGWGEVFKTDIMHVAWHFWQAGFSFLPIAVEESCSNDGGT